MNKEKTLAEMLSAWNWNSENFAFTEFYEDEMRRPTPCAVPFGLQKLTGS
jgi:hypothetical protein